MLAEAYTYLRSTPGATPSPLILDPLMLEQKGNLLPNLPGFVKKTL